MASHSFAHSSSFATNLYPKTHGIYNFGELLPIGLLEMKFFRYILKNYGIQIFV